MYMYIYIYIFLFYNIYPPIAPQNPNGEGSPRVQIIFPGPSLLSEFNIQNDVRACRTVNIR